MISWPIRNRIRRFLVPPATAGYWRPPGPRGVFLLGVLYGLALGVLLCRVLGAILLAP